MRFARPNCLDLCSASAKIAPVIISAMQLGGALKTTCLTPGSRRFVVRMLLRGRTSRILVLLHHFVVCIADRPGDLIPSSSLDRRLDGNALGQLAAAMNLCSPTDFNSVIGQIFQRRFDISISVSCIDSLPLDRLSTEIVRLPRMRMSRS